MAEAAPPRSSWLTLRRTPPSLEQACRRAHELASRHPLLYRWKVGALVAGLGLLPFATLIFQVGVALAFPWAFRESELLRTIYSAPVLRWALYAFVYATWIPLVVVHAAAVFRGLTLRLPPPDGIPLTEAEAPRLFRMLEEISRSLDAPAVRKVLISPDRRLEIRRVPRGTGGVLGPGDLVLLAGLPALEELSPQHLRALLAHEMAHHATYKRRFGGYVLAIRTALSELRAAAETSALDRGYWSRLPDETLTDILDGLLAKLIPATFPAVRQHESEADAIAAGISGREFAAAALLRQRIAGCALTQQFREDCLRLAETTPEPPPDIFERRAMAASGEFSESQIHGWLRKEVEHKDNLAESHPPLWDRLRYVGYPIEGTEGFRALLENVHPHGELGETAARFFLGDAAQSLRAQFFREWAQHQARDWRRRFDTYERLRSLAMEWNAVSAAQMKDPKALWQIAVAIGNTEGWKAALPVALRVLEIQPGHGDANLLAGQLLIEEGNRAGLESLERAMTADPGAIPAGCALAARFLEARGEQEGAAGYRTRAEERHKREEAIAEERSHVRATDTFLAPDCPAAKVEALRHAVQCHGSHVRAAYLMRKQVNGGDREPLYVLGVERRAFIHENRARANRLLLERIMRANGVPADVLVCVVTRANRALLSKWKIVPDSLLFPSASYAESAADSLAGLSSQTRLPVNSPLEPAGRSALPAGSSPSPAE